MRRGQILTPEGLAQCLASHLRAPTGSWLELGSGSGRLVQACLDAHAVDRYVGVELDHRLAAKMDVNERVELHRVDVRKPDALSAVLGSQRFDCVVGNPPFGIEKFSAQAQERFRAMYPQVQIIKDWARLDLYFMLESLTRLRRPGEAAFIVAAPIVQDAALAPFRKTLVEVASEIECYELPPKIFDNRAEVQCFLMVMRFGAKRGAKVTLGRFGGADFAVEQVREVRPLSAITRMDLAHHEFRDFHDALGRRSGFMTLADMGAQIVRGSRTRREFQTLKIEHFHTTDFPQAGGDVSFGQDETSPFQTAEPGHILVPRVGSRCIDRAAIVAHGRRAYTEAVYRLSLPQRNRAGVFDWMVSEEGRSWRRRAAHGSCAQHLTVASLMRMPVPG